MAENTYFTTGFVEETAIMTIALNRSDNERNQLNTSMVESLCRILEEQRESKSLRGLVIYSAREKVFSTGADIETLQDLDSVEAAYFSRRGREIFSMLAEFQCPTVAAISGFALGGGLELAMSCDFRIATASSRMGLPEINLGIIPGWGGTQRLQRLIGRGPALKMILSGDPVNAASAQQLGLVDEIVEGYSDLLPAAAKLLSRFTSKSRRAVALARRAVVHGSELSLAQGLELESELFGLAWSTPDREEGVAALKEKRRPSWPE